MCDDEKNDDLIIDIDDEDEEELDEVDKEVMGIDFIED
jgi:hypothetical protein